MVAHSAFAHRIGLLIILAGTGLGLSACGKSTSIGLFNSSKGETVQPSDFASPEATSSVATAQTPAPKAQPSTPAPAPAPAPSDTFTIGSIKTAAGTPPAYQPTSPPPVLTNNVGTAPDLNPRAGTASEPITLDSVVGQINGKPVIASEILEPLDGALRAAAEKARTPSAWRTASAERIVGELKRRIEDELVLSEARRTLTPEQRQGLFKFLETIQSNLVASQRGSSIAADETLREQTGRSLEEEAKDIRDQELIRNELRQKVLPRVVVSWRDVQNEYERSFDKWNPPAEYTFRMIYVPSSSADAINRISSDLSSGKLFAEVAASEANEFNRREGGKMLRSHAGNQSQGDFSPIPDINDRLRSIGVSQVIGPFTYAPDKDRPQNTRTTWLYLERIDQPEGTSLYDAQLDIENDLRSERTGTEIKRYFERLRSRGNVSKIEVMAEKLMQIATDRYAPRFKGK